MFVASLKSYNYGVTYVRLTSFILSIVFLDTISTGLVAMKENKSSVFFVFERNLFQWFDWFYFLIHLKSFYVSYWLFIYIKCWFLFQTYSPKQILFPATVYRRPSSCNRQRAIIVFLASLQTYNYGVTYFQ